MQSYFSSILFQLAIVLGLLPSNFILKDISDLKIKKANTSDSTVTISISIVGDLMCHSPQFEYAKVGVDSFNFIPTFKYVKNLLSKPDLTIGNLETVTAGKEQDGYTGYPRFNSPVEYLDALKDAGFDLLFTSNNHSLDRGEYGIIKTIDELRSRNISYIGTYSSLQDRDSIRIFNLKGTTIAFLAYSYGTNGNPVPEKKEYLINLINKDLMNNDIQIARNKNVDIVFVYFHFGEEYQREPNKFQSEIVDQAIESGADIIIGSHPHVIQPVTLFKTKNVNCDSGIIAFSLGNFISNQRKRYTDTGVILTLNIQKNIYTGEINLNQINFEPTWVFKGNTKSGKEYFIIPSENDYVDLEFLSPKDSTTMTQAFSDTKEIIRKYTNSPRIKEN